MKEIISKTKQRYKKYIYTNYRYFFLGICIFKIASLGCLEVLTDESTPRGVAVYPNKVTENIAYDVGYYQLKDKLRSKSIEILDEIESLKTAHENTYRQAGYYYQGIEFGQDYSSLYKIARDSFDQAFEEADRKLIFQGLNLDTAHQPPEKKKEFMIAVTEELKNNISGIIDHINGEITKIKNANT